jgi:hypothetical protein
MRLITALVDRSYDRIEFDAVDGTSVNGIRTQLVLVADEFDTNGTKYLKIVLVTPPMPVLAGSNKKDDQPGQ